MPTQETDESSSLARRLGLFDATMIVMGGIIGAGIFINPSVVARVVHTPTLILVPWLAGGAIALAGAFVYAELADRKPDVGGQYAYIRDAFHPMVAFLYGWSLLLVTQTGGMAAVAMTFAGYFRELTGSGLTTPAIAVATLLLLTAINCFGVRAGSNVQAALMVLKIVAVLVLVLAGARAAPPSAVMAPSEEGSALVGLAAAMVPVLFAYGGWQTASFVSGEMKAPRRDLPRALLIGVVGVVVLYVAVNVVCLHVLGADGLAATTTPASEVMRRVLGSAGARLIAAGIAVSTVGFLSQGMLTAPRVYFAMARDGVFFKSVAHVSAKSRAPVVAIAVQGVWASVIALSGRYEQILNYVVALDAVFFGLTGAALLVLRQRDPRPAGGGFRMPGHPWTTSVFVAAFWALALNTVVRNPLSAGIGVLILMAGVPVYFLWRRPAPA
ncbi:MAG TPA: amino acid permease [Gemmatimonadaceae bacterium]|nr:amino acid permease [Gemmatimonadaceae bacterium]